MSLITKKEKIKKAQQGTILNSTALNQINQRLPMSQVQSKGITQTTPVNLQKKTVQAPQKPIVLDEMTFGQQFQHSRKLQLSGGPSTFTWRGKVYGTQLAGETPQSRSQKDEIDIRRSPNQQLPQQRTTVPKSSQSNVYPIPQAPPTNVWGQPIPTPPPTYGWQPNPVNPWKQTVPALPKSDGSVENSRRSVNPFAEDAPLPQYENPYPLPGWFTPEMRNPWTYTQPKAKPQAKKESTSDRISRQQEFKKTKNNK